jgi:5-methyltetrahydropteroyltriglutamate--homocysteine methyltransferase
MKRSETAILSTHTGSLPRAAALMEVLARNEREAVDPAELDRHVRPAVEETVRRQVECGVSVVNDGEQSKTNFSSYHYHRLTGFSHLPAAPSAKIHPCQGEAVDFPDFFLNRWGPAGRGQGTGKYKMPAEDLCCTGVVGWKDFSEVERDIANLKEVTAGLDIADVFVTAISPGTYLPRNVHYTVDADYEHAMADTMAREYQAIVDAGFILQIDAPDLAVYYRMEEVTIEQHLEYMGRRVDLINYATRNLAPDRVRIHACWGADEAPHHRDIPLKVIVGELLRLKAAGLMVPGANGRHAHEWKVWQDVKLPAEKVLVPGVIDSTTNIIEHPEAVAERILNYAGVVGRERVIAGVDCGLAYGLVDPPIVWAKLRALGDGAALATQALWAKAA